MTNVEKMIAALGLNISVKTRPYINVICPTNRGEQMAGVRNIWVEKEFFVANAASMRKMMAHIKAKAEAAGFRAEFKQGGYLQLNRKGLTSAESKKMEAEMKKADIS